MEFGDKIKDLPTDNQTPEPPETQLLTAILKPAPQNNIFSFGNIVRSILIAVILYFMLNNDIIKKFLTKYISNPSTLNYCIYVFIVLVLLIYIKSQ